MKDDITTWLNKSGYPLELFLAAELKQRRYLTTKSALFVDVETGKNREIDVTGYHHGNLENDNYSCARRLIFECKKSEKPLLNLCADRELNSRFYHHAFHGDPERLAKPDAYAYIKYEQNDDKEKASWIGAFSKKTPLGYSLIPAFGKSDQDIYSGIMGLTKASTYYRQLFAEFAQAERNNLTAHLQDRNTFEMHLAIMVVDAPLFDIYLESDGSIEVLPSDWSVLKTKLPWKFDPHDLDEGYCIHVVTKGALPTFLDSTDKLYSYIYSPEHVEPLLDKRKTIAKTGFRYAYHQFRNKIFKD